MKILKAVSSAELEDDSFRHRLHLKFANLAAFNNSVHSLSVVDELEGVRTYFEDNRDVRNAVQCSFMIGYFQDRDDKEIPKDYENCN